MQDQDVPPVVVEGETGGVVAVVREAAIRRIGPDATNTAESTPHPWITATARRWPAATTAHGRGARAQALQPATHKPIPNRYPCVKTRLPVFSVSSTTCFSRQKFRKQRAS